MAHVAAAAASSGKNKKGTPTVGNCFICFDSINFQSVRLPIIILAVYIIRIGYYMRNL